MRLADEADFAVGAIIARPSQSRIVANGKITRIEPRMMQVLVALTQARGATVARGELIDRCWGGLALSNDALNRVIARLRRVLHEAAAGEEIETLPKIGYRLVAAAAAGTPAVTLEPGGLPAAMLAENQLAELYRRALHGLEQPSREQLELAAALLREVTQRAPRSALAWAGLAEAQRMLMLYLPPELQDSARSEAWQSAEHALALDPNTGDALATMADLVPRFGNWREIERRIEHALAIAPRSERLALVKAQFRAAIGDVEASAALFEQLRAANPLSARIAIGCAATLFDSGRTDDALTMIDGAHRLWPALILVWSECVRLNVAAKRFERAQQLLDAPPTGIAPEDPNLARRRLHLIALRDRRATDVRAAIENFTAFAELGLEPAIVATYALATLGSIHSALTVAEAIFAENPPQARALGMTMTKTFALAGQPDTTVLFRRDIAALRQSPRFAGVLDRIGLTQMRFSDKVHRVATGVG